MKEKSTDRKQIILRQINLYFQDKLNQLTLLIDQRKASVLQYGFLTSNASGHNNDETFEKFKQNTLAQARDL